LIYHSRTQRHTHGDVGALDHLGELLEADAAVLVHVGLHDGLVDDLLQLLVLEVAADHHLEDDEELAVADVAVAVDVVDLEGEAQLLLLVALAAEGREPGHELLEVDVAAAVLVEDGDHARGQRVRRHLRQRQELVALDRARVVLRAATVVSIGRERRLGGWPSPRPPPTLSSFMKRLRSRSTSSRSTGRGS
jgi:hypothetical protein